MSYRKVTITDQDTVILNRDLSILQRKAIAHDAYLYAVNVMGEKLRADHPWSATSSAYHIGWRAAMRDFADAVVAAPLEESKL